MAGGSEKAKAQILTLIGSYLKCTEGIRGEILYSWECVLAPDKPPLHGFSILSWASNRTVRLNNLGERLASNGSGIRTLLKAIWQCFHTLISVAGALSDGEEDAKIRAGRPLDIPLTYKNVKQLSAQSQGGPAVLLPATTTWGLCLCSPVLSCSMSFLLSVFIESEKSILLFLQAKTKKEKQHKRKCLTFHY